MQNIKDIASVTLTEGIQERVRPSSCYTDSLHTRTCGSAWSRQETAAKTQTCYFFCVLKGKNSYKMLKSNEPFHVINNKSHDLKNNCDLILKSVKRY